MRIDQFLNTVNIVKSRQIAKDMIDNKVVFLNGVIAKGSKIVKENDEIKITYIDKTSIFKILLVPQAKTTKKSEQDKYIKLL